MTAAEEAPCPAAPVRGVICEKRTPGPFFGSKNTLGEARARPGSGAKPPRAPPPAAMPLASAPVPP